MNDILIVDGNSLRQYDANTFGNDDPRIRVKLEPSDGYYVAFNSPNKEIMPYTLIARCPRSDLDNLKKIEGFLYLPQKAKVHYGGFIIKGEVPSIKRSIIDVVEDLIRLQKEEWDLPAILINFVGDIEIKEAQIRDDDDQSSSNSSDQGIVGVDQYFMFPKLDLQAMGVNELLKNDNPSSKDLTRLRFRKDPTTSGQNQKFICEYKSSQESSSLSSPSCVDNRSPTLKKINITSQHFCKIKEILVEASNTSDNEERLGSQDSIGNSENSDRSQDSVNKKTPQKRSLQTTLIERLFETGSPFKVPRNIQKEFSKDTSEETTLRNETPSPVPCTSKQLDEFEITFSQSSDADITSLEQTFDALKEKSQNSTKSSDSDVECIYMGTSNFKIDTNIKKEPSDKEKDLTEETEVDYDAETLVGDQDASPSREHELSQVQAKRKSESGGIIYSQQAVNILEKRLNPENSFLDGDYYVLPENEAFYEDGYYYIEGLIPVRHQMWNNVRRSNDIGSNISQIMHKALGPAYGRGKKISLIGTAKTKSLPSMICKKCNIEIPEDCTKQQVEDLIINTIIDSCLRPLDNSRLTSEQRKIYRTRLSTALSSFQLRFCPGKRSSRRKSDDVD